VDTEREAVLGELDRREQGGYERRWLPAWFDDAGEAEPVQALAYVAHPANPEYLGEAPLAELVRQIRRAHGPSGSNVDYVVSLARALRALGVDDDHVLDVAAALEAAEPY
jgi:cation transport regulator ChaC